MTSITEITLSGGEHLRIDGDAEQVQVLILSAARGSLMELAWMTEAETGHRIGVNPEHVLFLRAPNDSAPRDAPNDNAPRDAPNDNAPRDAPDDGAPPGGP